MVTYTFDSEIPEDLPITRAAVESTKIPDAVDTDGMTVMEAASYATNPLDALLNAVAALEAALHQSQETPSLAERDPIATP
ncbi:hypothetical protein [Rhodococcus sp. AQ5-07]|uniref:hypothetical protein n=1 Tax=Rhodococcus sp. AQ5-07 TaxID=2054902 RepID=UPI000DBF9638|nr:hypothetical protein [Rhodococcus sp. AQ5-07]RAL31814.1 hypothetical protein CVN56_27120 [Rhodococcus sp. AQ5-07]